MGQLVELADLVQGTTVKFTYENGDYASGVIEEIVLETPSYDAPCVAFYGTDDTYDLVNVSMVEVEQWPHWLVRIVEALNAGTLSEGEVIRVIAAALGRTTDEASFLLTTVRKVVL